MITWYSSYIVNDNDQYHILHPINIRSPVMPNDRAREESLNALIAGEQKGAISNVGDFLGAASGQKGKEWPIEDKSYGKFVKEGQFQEKSDNKLCLWTVDNARGKKRLQDFSYPCPGSSSFLPSRIPPWMPGTGAQTRGTRPQQELEISLYRVTRSTEQTMPNDHLRSSVIVDMLRNFLFPWYSNKALNLQKK